MNLHSLLVMMMMIARIKMKMLVRIMITVRVMMMVMGMIYIGPVCSPTSRIYLKYETDYSLQLQLDSWKAQLITDLLNGKTLPPCFQLQ